MNGTFSTHIFDLSPASGGKPLWYPTQPWTQVVSTHCPPPIVGVEMSNKVGFEQSWNGLGVEMNARVQSENDLTLGYTQLMGLKILRISKQ